MIYEMRTYDLKPRSLPEFLKRFGEAYEAKRRKFSELAAFWYTEIGPLNQVIHVWPYADLNERTRIRAEAVAAGGWPPATGELIARMQSEIMVPWPGSVLPKGELGPIFEMRTYTLNLGEQPKVQKAWEKPLAARVKLSPVVALWFSELGGLNKFVHIWPYKSMEERMRVRKQAVDSGAWPPKPLPDMPYDMIAQETKILLAAPFSPLK
jgi:hypothetical protein